MLFQKFFETISSWFPDHELGDLSALARLNPDKFYLENVRNVLGISSTSAQRICDTAVRQGAFQVGVEVVCPNGAVAATASDEASLPETVRCWTEEYDEQELPTRTLSKRVFYRLTNEAAAGSRSHAQPA